MVKLSNRLQMVADLVRPGKILADIGTDHAYLPVYLILENLISNAYAADLKPGPLENARATVEKYGLSDKVELVLSDGIRALKPNCCEDFVIAGMGGNLISDILDAVSWIRKPGTHFVLQPQSHAEVLREYLLNSGYEILRENVTAEGKHMYLCMEVVYTGEMQSYEKSDFYIGKLPESDSCLKEDYLKFIKKRLEIKRDALLKSDPQNEDLKYLDEVICDLKECLK